jgi:hypothetical protein
MIHPFDDFPLHQSSAPLLHPTSDSAGLYDRYFFNGFSADGSLIFGLALGVYPNREVMDAAFSVVVDGVQHNCRSSRRCTVDRTNTTVGSIAVEVIEPMLHHKIEVRDHHGISAVLEARAISAVIEEPTFIRRIDGRPVMDYTRITQFVQWSGWIDIDGMHLELDDFGAFEGCRDRSWGFRGGARGQGATTPVPQFFWLWTPTLLGDLCAHVAINDDAEGRSWHRSGALTRRISANSILSVLDERQVQRAEHVEMSITWQEGTRWAKSLTATVNTVSGDPVTMVYEPLARLQMSGLGYLHPEWGHGSWHDEIAETRDSITLAAVDPLHPTMVHVQQLCRVSAGDRSGLAVVEQLVVGPHSPSGFSGLLDGAT